MPICPVEIGVSVAKRSASQGFQCMGVPPYAICNLQSSSPLPVLGGTPAGIQPQPTKPFPDQTPVT
ncbi:hypothetical protein BDP81DRAFT_416286 [Colletotrichum phormii]|uniref:Uncharacterized protein n=1 Tax=Colletotrichum phormii TaxID=359342 RepID=A0AAJ0A1H6_9PEZI|nr:uncharacterized protein BDP81DRAFT_416286 [Colletotrichum phormii]KAK1654681.1 hypothetical protein BDP81DRAFT_416286 [Colletotrichum phormii]